MLHLVQIQQKKVLHHLQQIVKQVQIQRQINLHQILKSKIARCQILILKLPSSSTTDNSTSNNSTTSEKDTNSQANTTSTDSQKVVLQPMIIVLRQQVQR